MAVQIIESLRVLNALCLHSVNETRVSEGHDIKVSKSIRLQEGSIETYRHKIVFVY